MTIYMLGIPIATLVGTMALAMDELDSRHRHGGNNSSEPLVTGWQVLEIFCCNVFWPVWLCMGTVALLGSGTARVYRRIVKKRD